MRGLYSTTKVSLKVEVSLKAGTKSTITGGLNMRALHNKQQIDSGYAMIPYYNLGELYSTIKASLKVEF
jgi:hypothetical protein